MSRNFGRNSNTAAAATNALTNMLGIAPETLDLDQRKNAAWRLVCLHKSTPEMDGPVFTLRSLATLAGTTPETISVMRRRKRALEAEGQKPTGSWTRDRSTFAAQKAPEYAFGPALGEALKETLGDLIGEAGR